jgi:stage II sporulation protein M
MATDGRDPLDAPAEIPARGPTPGLIRRLYREERAAWRDHYRNYFKYAARALGLGFVGGFLYFALWPAQETKALELVVKALEDIRLEDSAPLLALSLFYHNARASLVPIFAGFVPFLFLPILDPLLNGGVIGLLVSVARHQHLDVPRLVLTQILPHGVFELTAVLYVTSLGMYLSAGMGKKAVIAWKNRMGTAPGNSLDSYAEPLAAGPKSLARNIVRSFVLVVLPLLLVAAAIESFVTPNLR